MMNDDDTNNLVWNTDDHRNDSVFNALFNALDKSDLIGSSKHAAAVVYRKRILAIGNNSRKSHPIEKKFNRGKKGDPSCFLHAEKDAIIKAMNKYGDDILNDCSLYVIRQTRGGNIGMSKPCDSCQDFINSVGIAHVYWTVGNFE